MRPPTEFRIPQILSELRCRWVDLYWTDDCQSACNRRHNVEMLEKRRTEHLLNFMSLVSKQRHCDITFHGASVTLIGRQEIE